ncbi:glycosyltransferase family 2 protein [Haloferula sargassicola]|uniref:Glycosyltransferase 2-like domain-containing protein n=1 Tax=Haloferula sargassicola TaxID=490096 RepID=A0ABP9UQZ5_9BACT
MNIDIIIPTYNRAGCLAQAVRSALNQNYAPAVVTVVDDGSSDATREVVEPWFEHPRFRYVRLETNGGTARAKNVGLALSEEDAITFHDSDDVAEPNKLLLQARALGLRAHADHILDWAAFGIEPGSELQFDVAAGAHRFIKLDGSVHLIDKRISLVDDFFPTLQSPSKTEGDWVLINSSLFRRGCFKRLGGFLDSVEEDRELRNRLLAAGHLFHFIAEPLLTKIEMPVSLTTDGDTGYRGEKRRRDREEVWHRNRAYRRGQWGDAAAAIGRTPIELESVRFAETQGVPPFRLADDLPMTAATRENLQKQLESCQRPPLPRLGKLAV